MLQGERARGAWGAYAWWGTTVRVESQQLLFFSLPLTHTPDTPLLHL